MTDKTCVLFDCDGTLVDSEILCCEAYVLLFAQYGIAVTLTEAIKNFKGVKLNEIFDRMKERHGLSRRADILEAEYRAHVARLFDERLVPIDGVHELLRLITVPVAVVSNGPVSKMEHSLGLTALLPFFAHHLYSGYDVQRWKPDPAVIYHAAAQLRLPVEQCILVEDSVSGAQAGIAAGIPVFYYCADPHNPPIVHPLVTRFDDMGQLPGLWCKQGWMLTRPAVSREIF
ncbi:6-phosphogluconate phosphatase [Acerihabitans arboris]|uniref:6-phosphogluconate phosphatase n=1 Tax=Acerihabitans arboris TaxID=2691583 RepID=A0A845SQH9_9GAMM|nr:6-phosphogluconate phosphatase [Acerihabitans arboris]NDL65612.1 6-phosphogluconate phosphatase [Acerihabitans arboris]